MSTWMLKSPTKKMFFSFMFNDKTLVKNKTHWNTLVEQTFSTNDSKEENLSVITVLDEYSAQCTAAGSPHWWAWHGSPTTKQLSGQRLFRWVNFWSCSRCHASVRCIKSIFCLVKKRVIRNEHCIQIHRKASPFKVWCFFSSSSSLNNGRSTSGRK